MTLIRLISSGPRNVKKRLFRDIITILLFTAVSITVLLLFQGISTKDKVSAAIISDASQLVQSRVINYFEPFDIQLRLLSKAGEAVDVEASDSEMLEKLFTPFLEISDDLTQILVIFQNGNYFKIKKVDDRFESETELFNGNNSQLQSRPYRGAMTASTDKPVFWSESFTSNQEESGISASIKVSHPQGKSAVVVFFIPATKMLSFIADIETTDNVDIILYNNTGVFLSKKQLYYLGHNTAMRPGDADQFAKVPEISKALTLWKQGASREKSVRKFSSEGITWWAGYSPISNEALGAWISIIIPETDIVQNVYKQWGRLGVLVAIIVALSFFMAFNLVRRYSFQLKDLPQQSLLDRNLVTSIRQIINAGESTTVEFKSTMRMNVKTGKSGKEIELAWLKSLVAFMNSDGGILIIGVNDDGQVTGIEPDAFTNEDKCRLHFKNLITTHIGASFSRYIHLKICKIEEKTILVVECERVRRPVFLMVGKSEDFLIRSGPSSVKLSMSQMVSYLSER